MRIQLPRPGAGILEIDPDQPPQPHSRSEAFLTALVRLTESKIVVEIGTFDGITTACLASALAPGAVLYGLDLWTEWAEPIVGVYGFQDYVIFLRGPSHDELEFERDGYPKAAYSGTIRQLPDGIEFAYVDGDHGRDSIQGDVDLLWPKIAAGGIVAFHDVNGIGIRDYLPGRFPDAIYFPWGQGLAIVQKPPKSLRRLEDSVLIPWA